MTKTTPPRSTFKQARLLLWALVALAVAGAAALVLIPSAPVRAPQTSSSAAAHFGGPFTLVGAHGKPFSSNALAGKPYAIYFGFTRCADVCPTTLSRLVRLRQQAGGPNALAILFVTIDPTYDGPKQVGQYATLFNSPIIGLTGSQAQIERVKKQYGIYAAPNPHATMGQEMMHTATVLLFDGHGQFVATISADEPDGNALDKLKRLVA